MNRKNRKTAVPERICHHCGEVPRQVLGNFHGYFQEPEPYFYCDECETFALVAENGEPDSRLCTLAGHLAKGAIVEKVARATAREKLGTRQVIWKWLKKRLCTNATLPFWPEYMCDDAIELLNDREGRFYALKRKVALPGRSRLSSNTRFWELWEKEKNK